MQYDVCTNTEEAKRPSRIDRRDLDRLASLGQLAPICGGLVIPKAAECVSQNNGVMGTCSLGVIHPCGLVYMSAMLHSGRKAYGIAAISQIVKLVYN
jgi:hypothetical protein